MRLRSEDGTQLSLTIVGYQFPRIHGDGSRDWDANWLVVSGVLTLSDGRQHSFTDPCLTTWEAIELQDWLSLWPRGVVPDGTPAGPTLDFTEPCLAFADLPLDGDSVEVQVYLSLEAEPPFGVAGSAGEFTNYVPLRMDRAALTLAAAEWAEDLRPFPTRG